MFKDYDKYLSTSLKVYIFVLMVIFIMKIVGLDYFGLDLNNETLLNIGNYLGNTHWGDVINFIILCIQLYFYLAIVCNKKDIKDWAVLGGAINYLFQVILIYISKMNFIYGIISILIMIIFPMLINKKFFIKKQIKYVILIFIYQYISLFIRNIGIHQNYGNFLIDTLLNIDQLLLLAITYNLSFMKGGIKRCLEELEAGFYSLKKLNLSTLLKELQRKLHNFKQLDKEEKLTHIIYFILSFIWNVGTIIVVLLVAKLNDTFIECLFILTSFWLSKSVFGKPFHLPSMKQCFIVSNLTYYLLNRLTTPLGISIFVPILLGVGLSYFTSKLVKKTYKPLYKGMPKELFEETILKVTDKESTKYKICYDFFINNKNALYLTGKYNYSEAGIRQIISRINKQIKDLK